MNRLRTIALLFGGVLGAVVPLVVPTEGEASSAALFIADRGCFGCHEAAAVKPYQLAPALDGVASKLRPGWIQRFLADPAAWQPGGRMPHLRLADRERADLQAFLSETAVSALLPSLPAGNRDGAAVRRGAEAARKRGSRLYEEMKCGVCHDAGVRAPDLSRAADKLERTWLEGFLLDPEPAMPSFDLSPEQVADLAEHLLRDATPLPVTAGSAQRGERLFVRHGCAACHRLRRVAGRPMEVLLEQRPEARYHDFELASVEGVLRGWLSPGSADEAGGEPGPRRKPGDTVADVGPDYWQLPVPPQGPAPNGWSGLERSLHPGACGVCHPLQFVDWRTSLHARAYGPGFRAELSAAVDNVTACRTCHAPLSEQQTEPGLRSLGVVCAACHVRGHRRHGPPEETDRTGHVSAHDGAAHEKFFTQARFCVRCHQFGEGNVMPGGKYIMDVYREWEASPYAAQDRPCQDCHMPRLRHLWRGVHDPDTMRQALRLEVVATSRPVEVLVTNAGAGHRLPTYVVPRLELVVWAEDGTGTALDGTERRWQIGRLLSGTLETEIFDTRLLPGETRSYPYDLDLPPGAVSIVAAVDVNPDHLYLGLYESRLALDSLDEATRALYVEAHDRPLRLPYRALQVQQDL